MTARDSSTSAGAQRICPKCGHANSNISLFCAECGAVLNGAVSEDAPAFQASPMSASNDTQGTQPIRTAEDEWAAMMRDTPDDAGATAPLPKVSAPPESTVTAPAPSAAPTYETPGASTTWASAASGASGSASVPTSSAGTAEAASAVSAYPDYSTTNTGVSFGMEPELPRSMRGFWLGVFAFVLILVVLGLYGWTILPEGGFRDTVQGWF